MDQNLINTLTAGFGAILGWTLKVVRDSIRSLEQAVDQSKLVPLLVAAVQELSAEIPALKIKVGS